MHHRHEGCETVINLASKYCLTLLLKVVLLDSANALSIFEGRKVRKIRHNEEWWFSVVDIIGALTESEDPRNYWKVLKFRLSEENGNQPVTFCNQLKLVAEDGKLRETDRAKNNTMKQSSTAFH